jgi:hypothetical protein
MGAGLAVYHPTMVAVRLRVYRRSDIVWDAEASAKEMPSSIRLECVFSRGFTTLSKIFTAPSDEGWISHSTRHNLSS